MALSQRLFKQRDRSPVGLLCLLATVLSGVNLPQQKIVVGDSVVSLAMTPAKHSVRMLDPRLRLVQLTLIHQGPRSQARRRVYLTILFHIARHRRNAGSGPRAAHVRVGDLCGYVDHFRVGDDPTGEVGQARLIVLVHVCSRAGVVRS
jgi:hypothetical protein